MSSTASRSSSMSLWVYVFLVRDLDAWPTKRSIHTSFAPEESRRDVKVCLQSRGVCLVVMPHPDKAVLNSL